MPPNRARLAEHVHQRRRTLRLTGRELARRAQLSPITVRALLAGRRVDETTLWKLEEALGWEDGSAERVLEGGDPTVATPDMPARQTLHNALERKLWGLTELTEERRWEIITALREYQDTGRVRGRKRTKAS